MAKKTLRSSETQSQVDAAAAVRRACEQLAQVEAELSRIDTPHAKAAMRLIGLCRRGIPDPDLTRALDMAADTIADALHR